MMIEPFKHDFYEQDVTELSSVSEYLLEKIAASINYYNHHIDLPIGSMMYAYLTEALFQTEYSDKWILCDGRDISETDLGLLLLDRGEANGTAYAPDFRGMVSIGLNYGRSDGKQNTVKPTLKNGEFMAGGVKSHTHTIGVGGETAWESVGTVVASGSGSSGYNSSATGQAQNTVNSIGSNRFIKVYY